MLYSKTDSNSYVQEFRKRFTNFSEKAPVLLSFTTTPQGVQIIDETTNVVYEVPWNFSVPVKSFIHGIKEILVQNCYPILEKPEIVEETVSKDEQIKLASDGVPLVEIPVKKGIKKLHKYLIDKVIIVKDIFILKDLETDKMFRYQLNKSSVFFLKKIRSGRFTSEQAAMYFFENAVLLNEIVQMEDADDNLIGD